jgi:hypothetical protein
LHLDNVAVAAVPEPEMVVLLAIGLGALAARRRQLKRLRPASKGDTVGRLRRH